MHVKKVCIIEDCQMESRSLELCRKHYRRFKKYGDPNFLHSRTCPNCQKNYGAVYAFQKWCSDDCKIAATRSESWKSWYAKNREKQLEYSSKYYIDNKSKIIERTKKWVSEQKENDPEYHRKRIRRARYGISQSEFEEKLSQQKNSCYICNQKFSLGKDKTKTPYVDHDHKTGKVRALLCHHCNLFIGHSRDNIEILANAITYLENSNDK